MLAFLLDDSNFKLVPHMYELQLFQIANGKVYYIAVVRMP